MTIVVTGSTIGGFVAVPLLAQVIETTGSNWRMGWFVVVAVCAVAFCCSILFVRNKPADIGQTEDGAVEEVNSQSDARTVSPSNSTVYKTTEDWTVREAVWHPTFWLLMVGLVSGMSAYGMMIGQGVSVKTEVFAGNPANDIVEYAVKNGNDLIVMGHSRAGLERVLLGSVAHRIVKLSPVPVMVVRVDQ